MSGKTLKQRIGIDIGRRISVEEGLEWAARNDVHFIDVQTDVHPNALESFDAQRVKNVRKLKKNIISIWLAYPLWRECGRDIAFCREAVDQYLKAYIDLARKSARNGLWYMAAIISPIANYSDAGCD